MIQLSRISKIPLSKTSNESSPKASGVTVNNTTDLKMMPQYPVMPGINVKVSAKKALSEFKKDYGEIKSSTYIAECYRQAKQNGASDEVLDKLTDLRHEYLVKIKNMRKNVYSVNYDNYDDYIKSLNKYIKENGSYMNCNECADLMLEKLRKKGLKATNVCLYTQNNDGQRTSRAEHVFTVAGLRENADITNPETWGSNAVICDAWAGICENAKDGLDFYKNLFVPKGGKNCFGFEYCNRNYGMK